MTIRKKMLSLNRDKIVQFISFVAFIAILLKVFSNVTYIFRITDYDRSHVVGIKNEKNLDMVYIGGSAAFVYWQPPRAWNDCGFTSYLYATSSIQAEQIKAYIQEVRKSQNPELFVVGARAFEYYSDTQSEAGIRKGTDSMDLTSIVRYKLLHEYFSHRLVTDDTDILSYYLDIVKYHTNTENLSSSAAWSFRENNGVSYYKGWQWLDYYAPLEKPTDFMTESRGELPDNAKETLIDLLTYCQEEKLNVLFVVCPFQLSKENQEKFNTIGDIIESYGFNYLNTNEYYDEMGIDFVTDFYNSSHVNLFGAAKYTEFLEKYILDNYGMPDHRGDDSFADWDRVYQNFLQEEETHSKTVTELRLDVEHGLEIGNEMLQSENLSEWNDLAEDKRFTLFIASDGKMEWPKNIADQKVINRWEFTEENSAGVRIVKNAEILDSNTIDGELFIEGDSVLVPPYRLSIENDSCSIIVNGKEWCFNQDGINVLVFSDDYQKVVDVLSIRCDENGRMKMYRD